MTDRNTVHQNQDKRKNLKMNLDHFSKSPNPLVKDVHTIASQRQNLPKLTPFNQQTLIEKSQERLKLTQSMQSGRLEVPPDSVYDFTSDDLQDLGEIGRGAFGTVNKMVHRKSNTVMAVKRIRSTIDEKEQKILLMDLDVVMKSNDCPFIVKFYGALFKEGDCWICMQLMDTSLDKFYKFIYEKLKQRMPESIIGKITVATVKALNYLKEKLQIIHRDVKPSNILLDKQGNIKLCDFGISGQLVDSIARTRDAGCRPYMAPERIDPQTAKGYDVRSDVWSLGITLMEISTGRFPYPKWNTVFEQLNQVVKGDPPRLSINENGNCFTYEFVQFVNTCLIKDETERPKYNVLLQHPFIKRADEDTVDVAQYDFQTEKYMDRTQFRFKDPVNVDETEMLSLHYIEKRKPIPSRQGIDKTGNEAGYFHLQKEKTPFDIPERDDTGRNVHKECLDFKSESEVVDYAY